MNLSRLIIAPVFPWWLICILLALGLGFSFFQFWVIRKRLSRNRSLGLFLLRLAALSLIILFALNPSWLVRKEGKVLPNLAILLDTSPGMGLPGQAGKGSRLDDARALLLDGSRPLLKSLAERFDAQLYGLSEPLKALKPGELSDLKVEERKSDLDAALAELAGKNSLALLLSDGGLKWEDKNSADLPLLTLPVGDPEGYRDIMIHRVKAPALAFRGREVGIDVAVKSYGYPGVKLPVVLKDGERLLAARDLRLNDRNGEGTVSLSFTPEEVGARPLSISIPTQFGEALTSNNQVNLSLRVVRDKIRILMITGSPSLNYRYLRLALKNDPSLDLLSFVILRLPSNILNVPVQEQSLIPIPVDTLFAKELKNFDLLIFDNFLHNLFFRGPYLEKVREFVRGGGGFAMIGGPNFSGEGGYVGTALEEVLPVRWAGREDYRRDLPVGVKLSRAGVTHPLPRFSAVKSENLNLWEEMPSVDGFNLLRPKSSGTVLLESADENAWPILTVGTYGKGRVLVLATDYSWKWYMGMVARGKGNWAYLRLMERLVRWLTQDPSLDPVQITLPEETGKMGQETQLRIRVQEDPFSSRANEAIALSVLNAAGDKIGSQLKPSGQAGEYIASFLPEKAGTYKIKVETRTGNREETLIVGGPGENLDGFPNHEQLKKISSSTRGKTLGASDDLLKELETFAPSDRNRFRVESRIPLWDQASILILILTLLAMEWYLRRRWGLI